MTEFTATQKLAAITREIGYRKFVYPKRVATRQMKQDKMDHEIAVMEAIAADYAKPAEEETAKARLL